MKQYENISLKPFNTFGIDVKARRLVVIEEEADIESIMHKSLSSFLILGAGSDMVFTRDYEGTVLTLANKADVSLDGDKVTAWAGMRMDDLIQWTLDQGLYGPENLSAIPGTVGASAVQNVGAYGAEAKDFIVEVETIGLHDGQRHIYSGADCRFGYRTSRFKEQGGELILRVVFQLSNSFVPNLSYKALEGLPHDSAQQMRDAITALRWQKLPRPEEYGSAGSFFKNPVVDESAYQRLRTEYPDMPDAHRQTQGYKLSAGWLIDRAGWKGKVVDRVGVWPTNALILYNAGGCSGREVESLASAIRDDVRRKFGVDLEPEAIII